MVPVFERARVYKLECMLEQAVSRVLFSRAVTRPGTMTIHLAPMLPSRSSDLPGNSGGPPSNVPLFGLAPGGVCRAPVVTDGTGELLPHLFTLTPGDKPGSGVFSVALSFLSPGLGVTQHPVLWSPDFPPPRTPSVESFERIFQLAQPTNGVRGSGHLSCSNIRLYATTLSVF